MDRRRFLALLGVAPVLVACDPVRAVSQVLPGSDGSGDVGDLSGNAQQFVTEAWHYVGGSGEPAFQNSWVNVGSTNAALAFRIREAGIVDIQGIIKDGVGIAVFALPSGYRPTTIVQVPITVRAPSTTNTSAGVMSVDTDGTVRVFYNNGSFPGTAFVYGQVFLAPPAVP